MSNKCFCFIPAAQEWNDYNLRWNETEYGNVKDLRITPSKLWKPDVLMYNRSVVKWSDCARYLVCSRQSDIIVPSFYVFKCGCVGKILPFKSLYLNSTKQSKLNSLKKNIKKRFIGYFWFCLINDK